MPREESSEEISRRSVLAAGAGVAFTPIVAADSTTNKTNMSIRNRFRKAAQALIVNPDRVVYLKDDPDGEKRVALFVNSITTADSDAEALERLGGALFCDGPGVNNKVARNHEKADECR